MKRVAYLVNRVVFFILFFSNLSAESLGGSPKYFAYKTQHNVFYNRQSAIGFVRMDNGFTVTVTRLGAESKIASSVIMDTCVSVSGAIDLRDTNTIILLSDLILDHGVTLSSGGEIHGYDRTVIMNGDLTIPANKILHITGRIILDGNGNTLNFADRGQLFVDTGATLTLRNLTIKNTKNYPSNPCIKCVTTSSNLALDNVEFSPTNDFYFDQGYLFIHNDVAFTGSSAFVYRSPMQTHITSGACLHFAPGTTFDFKTATTGAPGQLGKNLFILDDASSKLWLDGATLKSTFTGICLTKGQLILDNKVTLSNREILNLTSATLTTSVYTGGSTVTTEWSPDGKYLFALTGWGAANVLVYRHTGSSLIKISQAILPNAGNIIRANLSPDGKYLAVIQYYGGITLYSWNGSQLQLLTTVTGGDVNLGVHWSPDGKYLAVTRSSRLEIYSFNGITLRLVAYTATWSSYGRGVAWHPSGKYVVVGRNDNKSLEIFLFTGTSLSSVASKILNFSTYVTAFIRWSSDGRYFASTTDDGYACVWGWDGRSSIHNIWHGTKGRAYYEAQWSSDGRYIAYASGSAYLYVFEWNAATPLYWSTRVFTLNLNSPTNNVSWHPDGTCLAVSTILLNVYKLDYARATTLPVPSNSIVFGNSTLGSNYDLDIQGLAGTYLDVIGLVKYDNVN